MSRTNSQISNVPITILQFSQLVSTRLPEVCGDACNVSSSHGDNFKGQAVNSSLQLV